jgi:hypothetical protein
MSETKKFPVKLFIVEKEHNLDSVIAQGSNWLHIDVKMDKKDIESSNKIIKIDRLGFAPSDPTPVELDDAGQFFVLRKFKDEESGMTFIYGWPKTDELREG